MGNPVKTVQVSIPRSLYSAVQADADALGIAVKELASRLLYIGLEQARGIRYAPYHLPDSYGWDVFGQSYTQETERPDVSLATTVTPLRKSRRSSQ